LSFEWGNLAKSGDFPLRHFPKLERENGWKLFRNSSHFKIAPSLRIGIGTAGSRLANQIRPEKSWNGINSMITAD
jgi:hypothetical protein